MPKFQPFNENVEVNGETVLSVLAGMGSFKDSALKILEENGINSPRPGNWYKQKDWLNSFRDIAQKVGPLTLYTIGQKIPENAQFPPEIDDINKALSSIDVAYHMNHRGGEIGKYSYTKTGEKSAQIAATNPYPSDFDRGIIEAMAKRFKPRGSFPKVTQTGNDTSDTVTYTIAW